jgi:hypothetical protein
MICVLKRNDEFLYLDATEKYSRIGEYAERIQNKTVMIEDGKSYLLKKVPESLYTTNKEYYDLDLTLSADNTLKGTIKVHFEGEPKVMMMNLLSDLPGKERTYFIKKVLSSKNNHLVLNDIELQEPNRDENYEISGTIEIPDFVNVFDNNFYVYLDPIKELSDYKLEEDREFPLWFDFKRNIDVNVHFTVPKEYTILALPEPFKVENKEYNFSINYQKEGNQVVYNLQSSIPDAEISKDHLKSWNSTIKMLNNAYEQPIILKPKSL